LTHQEPESAAAAISRRTFLAGAAAACFLLPLEAGASVGLFEPFSFAVVSDVRLCNDRPDTYMMLRESQLFLQDIVRQLNDEKLDFVIFLGDQVEALGRNQANWQLFQDIAQGLNAPWSFVLGEHDLADELPVDKMKVYGPDWRSRGIETDKPYWSQTPLPGVHLIGLDTGRANSPTGDMGSRQLEWLKGDLAANRRKFTIVFSHHPLLPPPPYDGGPPWDEYILPPGPAVREVLGSSPYVKLAISGHVLASKVQREKDIWYVACPSAAAYPCAYRLFQVTPDAITMTSRQVSFPALVKKAKKLLIASSLAYKFDSAKPEAFVDLLAGTRLDSDALLPLAAGAEAKALAKTKAKNKKHKGKEKESSQAKKKKKTKEDSGPAEGRPVKQDENLKTKTAPEDVGQSKPGPASSPEDAGPKPGPAGVKSTEKGAPDAVPAQEIKPQNSQAPSKPTAPETEGVGLPQAGKPGSGK
jgi:3',5'-cyclic AMP phosphodiesterase CpdA